jgi:hypothetical protein
LLHGLMQTSTSRPPILIVIPGFPKWSWSGDGKVHMEASMRPKGLTVCRS